MPAARAAPALPRTLAFAYALLIAYACLHPLSGWSDSGLPLFDYLVAPWPKYYRVEDLVLNLLGYLPLGFLLVPALSARIGAKGAIVLATLAAGVLSLALETTQHFLPTRVSSNVDLGCNLLGAFVGAVFGAWWGQALFDPHGWLHRWRSARVIPGHTGDLGLVLLGLWVLAQLVPDSLLFGSGDLRQWLGLPTPLHFNPERFIRFEAALVAITIVAVGLFARCMMRTVSPWPLLLLFALGLGAKSVATAAFFMPGAPLVWLTPGASQGLLWGLPLLGATLLLPRLHQHALAGVAMLAATTLTNLLPENPFFLVQHGLARSGNFLNFHGLTRLIANLWPFFALAYLSALGLWRGEHLNDG